MIFKVINDSVLDKCLEGVWMDVPAPISHRLEQELEELETGVSATSTKENLSDVDKEEDRKTGDNKVSPRQGYCPLL